MTCFFKNLKNETGKNDNIFFYKKNKTHRNTKQCNIEYTHHVPHTPNHSPRKIGHFLPQWKSKIKRPWWEKPHQALEGGSKGRRPKAGTVGGAFCPYSFLFWNRSLKFLKFFFFFFFFQKNLKNLIKKIIKKKLIF